MIEPTTLVWIDAREAVIVRWQGDAFDVERLESGVPAHHRATGHVRHDPTVRHGGGGPAQTADEPRRIEHLARFIDRVSVRLPTADALLLIGPGTVRERLARHVRAADDQHGRTRRITCAASPPRTLAQLVARLRHATGDDPPRRRAGPYRRADGDALVHRHPTRQRLPIRQSGPEDSARAMAAPDREGG